MISEGEVKECIASSFSLFLLYAYLLIVGFRKETRATSSD